MLKHTPFRFNKQGIHLDPLVVVTFLMVSVATFKAHAASECDS